MTGLGDRDVCAEADAQGQVIAGKVGQAPGQGAADAVGLVGRPLVGEAEDLGREGLQGVAVELGLDHQRFIDAAYLEEVGVPAGDRDQQADDAGAAHNPGGPVFFEAATEVVQAHDAAEGVQVGVQSFQQVGEGTAVDALQGLAALGADLGWLQPQIIGDVTLQLGFGGDADAAIEDDALRFAQRAGGELPDAVERKAGAGGGAAGAELVQRFDNLGQSGPANAGQLEQGGAGERRNRAHRGQPLLLERRDERCGQRQLPNRLGRVDEVGDERRIGRSIRERGRRDPARAQRRLEGDDIGGGLGADGVDGAHLRLVQRQQTPDGLDMVAGQGVDCAARQARSTSCYRVTPLILATCCTSLSPRPDRFTTRI